MQVKIVSTAIDDSVDTELKNICDANHRKHTTAVNIGTVKFVQIEYLAR